MEISKGSPDELEEIIDFGNYVFSHSHEGIDFPTLLPKLYNKEYEMGKCHYLIKEKGRIKAMVGVFPNEVHILDENLKINGIGTVAAHPYSRGKGYMKALMKQAVEEMEQANVDMSVLSGKKQRYEHFGYAVVGTGIQFTLPVQNLEGELLGGSPYQFRQLEKDKACAIKACYNLHQQQNVKFNRELEKFYDISCSWQAKLWGIYQEERVVGYMISRSNQEVITEICLEEPQKMKEVLGYFIRTFNLEQIRITVAPYDREAIESLRRVSERYMLQTESNVRIFNFQRVLQALLKLKQSYTKLMTGTVTLGIKGYGCYQISVKDEKIAVECVDIQPDIVLDYFEAMDLLFSPIGHYMYLETASSEKLQSYFPLPLFIPSADRV